MRFVYVALVVLITLAVVIFNVQNIGIVTVSFLAMNLTLPLSILVIFVYLLGMLTGGAAISLIRFWVKGATAKSDAL